MYGNTDGLINGECLSVLNWCCAHTTSVVCDARLRKDYLAPNVQNVTIRYVQALTYPFVPCRHLCMSVTTSTDRNEGGTVWLTAQQVAKRFGVTVRAVRTWGDNGDLPSLLLPNGRRRYPEKAIDEYFEENFQDKGRQRASSANSPHISAELPGQGRLPV